MILEFYIFLIVLLFAYKKKKNKVYPTTSTHYHPAQRLVQWKPEAAEALSTTKLCWDSNPLCVALCCNINFINITASTLSCIYGFCRTKRKWKCYQNFNPFLFIYFYLFCSQFCADAGVTEKYKVKELSELRSLYYVWVCLQFCVLIWTENILNK